MCCFTIRVMILFIRMMKTLVGMMGDCLCYLGLHLYCVVNNEKNDDIGYNFLLS